MGLIWFVPFWSSRRQPRREFIRGYTAAMTDTATDSSIRGRVVSASDASIHLAVPGTSYQLTLACDAPPPAGAVTRGWIGATAMSMHGASAGGRFIEPTIGAPRIVAGQVVSIDTNSGTALVQSAVPMVVQLERAEDAQTVQVGDLVNFHVRSGARWHVS